MLISLTGMLSLSAAIEEAKTKQFKYSTITVQYLIQEISQILVLCTRFDTYGHPSFLMSLPGILGLGNGCTCSKVDIHAFIYDLVQKY
jgi:hypothetical protein